MLHVPEEPHQKLFFPRIYIPNDEESELPSKIHEIGLQKITPTVTPLELECRAAGVFWEEI